MHDYIAFTDTAHPFPRPEHEKPFEVDGDPNWDMIPSDIFSGEEG